MRLRIADVLMTFGLLVLLALSSSYLIKPTVAGDNFEIRFSDGEPVQPRGAILIEESRIVVRWLNAESTVPCRRATHRAPKCMLRVIARSRR